jgi:superfamily I DNA/RNA helicase
MSLQFIEGGAGTGKTTTVIDRLGQLVATSPLGEHQRVLALTKMHGSRRRVRERLGGVAGLNGRFESVTIDSFAWRIVRRWRSLARVVSGPTPTEFNEICEQAGRLLEEPCVQKWVASAFPIVVVDELQDSKGGQLRVLKGLSMRCECIAAGDSFQDLDGDGACASVEWARQQATPTVLTTTHRTQTPGLLAAAAALRDGQAVVPARGFSLVGVPAYGLGAWEVALKIAAWCKLGTVAVITPVTAARSDFVRQVVELINAKPVGKQRPIGPFKLFWEAGHADLIERTCREAGIPDGDEAVVSADALTLTGEGRTHIVRDWVSRQRRLFGRREFRSSEVRDAVRQLVQHSRGHAHHEKRRLSAMSIHQAKNREFDRVIVLWPYEVSGSDERKRRLAYNAITRARHEAHVIVQNKTRIGQPPFAPSAGSSSSSGRRRSRGEGHEEQPRAPNGRIGDTAMKLTLGKMATSSHPDEDMTFTRE